MWKAIWNVIYADTLTGYISKGISDIICTVNGSITDEDNACKKWRKKQEEEYDLSAQRFDEAEEDIKRLIMMFGDCE